MIQKQQLEIVDCVKNSLSRGLLRETVRIVWEPTKTDTNTGSGSIYMCGCDIIADIRADVSDDVSDDVTLRDQKNQKF